MGAWIEIVCPDPAIDLVQVAPLVGAWIEIPRIRYYTVPSRSLPLWERGLKLPIIYPLVVGNFVAPLVGAWIEIGNDLRQVIIGPRRSPCGSVD